MNNEKNIHPRSVIYTPVKKYLEEIDNQSNTQSISEVLHPPHPAIPQTIIPLVNKKDNIIAKRKSHDSSVLNILSLGAGVQSSTLLLMSLYGEIPPLDYVIFADTGWEPTAVYEHLEKLKKICYEAKLSLITVRAKDTSTIYDDPFNEQNSKIRTSDMPLYIRKKDGAIGGMIQRRCTGTYKVKPILKMLTTLRKKTGAEKIIQWLGISIDEAHRMRDNASRYVENYYPLIEMKIDRNTCHSWLIEHGWLVAKSSCIGCPYHSDNTWSWLKNHHPSDFNEAVLFDKNIRTQNNKDSVIHGDIYLHRARKPLSEINFKPKNSLGKNNFGSQTGTIENNNINNDYLDDDFGNECEGLCGV